ncbi:MAG: hypothetical protein IT223_09480, partial [Crocinitomicaceae bacterium]|nr:hypothetical protein [Crocinitomicaceae bacterium]
SSPYKWYKLDFPPDWRDVQPMVWEGFEVSPRFTYRIHLAEKGKHWMDDTDPKLRNMIMKAQRDGLKIIIPENSEIVLRQIIAGLNEKSIKHHPQLLENIINSGDESGMASLQVLDKEKPVYSAAFRIAGNEAYYLLATFDKSAGSNAISAFGLYSVIEYCREKECSVFDFEGSMIPGVEKFFRSFGGELTPYFSIKGGRPFWRWMMKKWKKG